MTYNIVGVTYNVVVKGQARGLDFLSTEYKGTGRGNDPPFDIGLVHGIPGCHHPKPTDHKVPRRTAVWEFRGGIMRRASGRWAAARRARSAWASEW
jgi:hypothetical protein